MGSELGPLKQLGATWATQTSSQHIIMADAKTQKLMEDLGLKKKDIDAVNFAFDAGDVLRACNMNPTLAAISKANGGVEEEGKKYISLDAFYPIFKAAKDEPRGGFHDFVEILKLYDKNADDTIQGNDLFKLLTNLGEKLTKEEAKILMNELCEPEDEDGFMQFKPFLERMCAAEK